MEGVVEAQVAEEDAPAVQFRAERGERPGVPGDGDVPVGVDPGDDQPAGQRRVGQPPFGVEDAQPDGGHPPQPGGRGLGAAAFDDDPAGVGRVQRARAVRRGHLADAVTGHGRRDDAAGGERGDQPGLHREQQGLGDLDAFHADRVGGRGQLLQHRPAQPGGQLGVERRDLVTEGGVGGEQLRAHTGPLRSVTVEDETHPAVLDGGGEGRRGR